MSQLIIRVGGAVDRSVSAAFKSVTDAAKAAQRTIAAGETQTTRTVSREARVQADAHVREHERAMRARARIQERSALMAGKIAAKEVADAKKFEAAKAAEAAKAEEKRVRDAQRAADARSRIEEREWRRRTALVEREWREIERGNERAMRSSRADQKRTMRRLEFGAGVVAGGVMRNVAGAGRRALNFASGVTSDVASGAGLRFDTSDLVSRNTSLEARAVDLSNQGYQSGAAGANGVRQDPKALERLARNVGSATAFDPSAILEAMSAFTNKTGDLKSARDTVQEMARLSRATGTELQDMADAAGDVANQLGDVPDKGEAVLRVMRTIAGQGKLGAVEIKDMASQMAKVAAAAGNFEGSKERNLAIFGAFAQEARQQGGAATATQAATSAQSFANSFTKSARMNAFKDLGINVMSGTERGKFRNPVELIEEALVKTKGDPGKMNKLVMDVAAKRVTGGFAKTFNEAFNAAKGTEEERAAAAVKAYRAEVERLTQAAMGEGEVRDSFAAAMGTTESKMTVLNNKILALADGLGEKAIPAIEKAVPELMKLAPAVFALVPPFLRLSTAATNIANKLLGTEDAAANEAGEQLSRDASDTIAGIRTSAAEKGTISEKDFGKAKEQQFALAAEQNRRHAATKKAYDLSATDYLAMGAATLAGGLPGFYAMGHDIGRQREQRRNVAAVEEKSAAIVLERQSRTLEAIRDALTKGTLKVVSDEKPRAKADTSPEVRTPARR